MHKSEESVCRLRNNFQEWRLQNQDMGTVAPKSITRKRDPQVQKKSGISQEKVRNVIVLPDQLELVSQRISTGSKVHVLGRDKLYDEGVATDLNTAQEKQDFPTQMINTSTLARKHIHNGYLRPQMCSKRSSLMKQAQLFRTRMLRCIQRRNQSVS